MGIQYARSSAGHLVAYECVGDGDTDVVLIADWMTPLEARWAEPLVATSLRRLARLGRLISFDKRGLGLSDPVPFALAATPEEWVDDARVVMDEVGATNAVVIGVNEGGPIAALIAATDPQRCRALVLVNTSAHRLEVDPWSGELDALLAPLIDDLPRSWAAGDGLELSVPGVAQDLRLRSVLATWRRQQASPAVAINLNRMIWGVDIRAVLSTITTATLVLHRQRMHLLGPEHGRFLARHIRDARLVELPGEDMVWWAGDADALIDEISTFVTGRAHAAESDRILSTVLFTDIVGSTGRAAALGDRRWRSLLDRHDELVAATVAMFGGRVVKTTGDGVLATFDGPARAVRCGCAITQATRSLDVEVRVGIHTGEIEVRGQDVAGLAVHMAARVNSEAGPSEVLVSRTVTDLVVGSGLEFVDRGLHELRGVEGTWNLFAAMIETPAPPIIP